MHHVRKIADACPNGIDCPRVYQLEEGRGLLVQGLTVTDPDVLLQLRLRRHEAAVAIPRTLRAEAVGNLGPCRDRHLRHQLHALPDDVLVVVGTAVTRTDLLDLLHLPAHESAVHVPAAVLYQASAQLREAV